MSHSGGGKWALTATIVIIVAILGFVVFLVARISRHESPPLAPSATSTAVATKPVAPKKATSTTSTFINRFFSWLGYDFSTLNRPPKRTGGGSLGIYTPPAAIANPPPQAPIYTGPTPEGFTRADLSRYYDQIRIANVWHPDLAPIDAFRNSYAEIELTVSIPDGMRVNMTGWRVESRNGAFVVPRANEVLTSYDYESNGTLSVRRGDRVRIFSRGSPNSINFRLNKCTGYFPGFIPALPRECPYLYRNRGELSNYSGRCQDYVLSLSRCELPASQPPIQFSDNQCLDLLRTANYQNCFDAHRGELDFLGNEWRVYLGTPSNPQKNIFDPLHDRVRVFDGEAKLVAQYLY